MEALPDLMSYEEALDFLREKEAIGSPLTTAEWAQVPAEVRRRAFFSATLTSARVAEKMQGYIDDFLSQDRDINEDGEEYLSSQGRSEFVIKMRELLEKEGFGKVLPDGTIDPNINDNDLRDLRSARRLQLIFDTQVEQACSYGQWLEGQDPDVLDIFPAQRFIRVRPVLAPRAYHEEALDTVRRKDDSKFWIGLNRDFGLPYGPWGFNSGCGVEDVDRDEAEELGVIKPDETPKPQTQHFNEKHQQSTAGLRPELKDWAEEQLDGMADFQEDKAILKPLTDNVENNLNQDNNHGRKDTERRNNTNRMGRKDRGNDNPETDVGGREEIPGTSREGMGRRTWNAEEAGRVYPVAEYPYPKGRQFLIESTHAQVTAVIEGRKPMWFEPLTDSYVERFVEALPKGNRVIFEPPYTCIYNEASDSKMLGLVGKELEDKVRELVREEKSGILLGYGQVSMMSSPSYHVTIF